MQIDRERELKLAPIQTHINPPLNNVYIHLVIVNDFSLK